MSVNSIVQVNVSQIVAPTPATLQQTGAFVSQGGSITSPGTSTFLSQLSDLLPYLPSPAAVTSVTVSGTTATVTTTNPHHLPTGKVFGITLAGFTPTNLNQSWKCTITGANTYTFTVPSSYASASVEGTWVLTDSISLTQRATTFFAQGASVGVYVLEMGALAVDDAIAALSAYLTENPNTNYTPGAVGYYYAYLVPRSWDANTNFLNLIASYENTTARTYFFTTTTLATYSAYTSRMKCVVALIEAPVLGSYAQNALSSITYTGSAGAYVITATSTSAHGVTPGMWFQITGATPTVFNGWWKAKEGTTGTTLVWDMVLGTPATETVPGYLVANLYSSPGIASTEFSLAAAFWNLLHYNPSTTNRVTPFEYSFVFGVTPFPTAGNNSLLNTLKQANINVIGTGAEGGISNTILLWGNTMDGNDLASYWYSVDWVQINLDLFTANAIINGNNNPINPLYYNQSGINYLQSVAASVMSRAITYGLCLGAVTQTSLDGITLDHNLDAGAYAGMTVVNAVPFVPYTTDNPTDYANRLYKGLSVIYIPQNGFSQIVYNVSVTELVSN